MADSSCAILREMVLGRAAFVAELLGLQQYPVPRYATAEFVEPVEDCDGAVVLRDATGRPVFAASVLVQTETGDPGRWSWLLYAVGLWDRYDRCPSTLLVVAPDVDVARWAAVPIDEPGLHMEFSVVGPEQVPVVDDPDAARRSPEMAVLSGMVHGPERPAVLNSLAAALPVCEERAAFLYLGLVYARLPAAARTRLEHAYARALTDGAGRR